MYGAKAGGAWLFYSVVFYLEKWKQQKKQKTKQC